MVFALPSVARSECVTVPVDVRRAFQHADAVFSGTLVQIERDDTLTFRADRIWKGPSSHEIVVFQLGRPFVGSFVFRRGTRYLIFANLVGQEDRKLGGIPDGPAFGIPQSCGSEPWPLDLVPQLDKIARSQKPRH